MKTDENGVTHVDTTTDTPYTIGSDMWEGSGNMSTDEAIKSYGSKQSAAQAVADLFQETGASWEDQDGDELSVFKYVMAYLKDA